METSYTFDKRAIWYLSLEHLVATRLLLLIVGAFMFILGVVEGMSGTLDWLGYVEIELPLLIVALWLAGIQRHARLSTRSSDNTVHLLIDENGVTSTTAYTTTTRTWEGVQEIVFLRDYLLFVLKGSYGYFVLPRTDKEIENYSVSMVSSRGGRVPTQAERAHSRRLLMRNSLLIIVLGLALVLLKHLDCSRYDRAERKKAIASTKIMQTIARERFGLHVGITPVIVEADSGQPTGHLVVDFSSDSVSAPFDTLATEYKLLKVIDSLLTFRAESFDFSYSRNTSFFTSVSITRSYSHDQAALVLEQLKR